MEHPDFATTAQPSVKGGTSRADTAYSSASEGVFANAVSASISGGKPSACQKGDLAVYSSVKGTAGASCQVLPKTSCFGACGRGRGAAGLHGGSTAAQVAAGYSGKGRVAIVTGANCGLGLESARVLALTGAEVIMAVRDVKRGEVAAAALRKQQQDARLTLMHLDLASLASVQAFADAFVASGRQLNILMENAGIMAAPFHLTEDGHESQWQVNFLSHFLLTQLLLPNMVDTARLQGVQGRIVMCGSVGHTMAYKEGVRLDRLNDPKGYSELMSYGQSKVAVLLCMRELALRLKGLPVVVAAAHPGMVLTKLGRHVLAGPFGCLSIILYLATFPLYNTIPQGAAPQVYIATAPNIVSGEYYGPGGFSPSSALTHDAALGRRLWEAAVRMVQPGGADAP